MRVVHRPDPYKPSRIDSSSLCALTQHVARSLQALTMGLCSSLQTLRKSILKLCFQRTFYIVNCIQAVAFKTAEVLQKMKM